MSVIPAPRRGRRPRPAGDDDTPPLSDAIERLLPGDPEPPADPPAEPADAEPSPGTGQEEPAAPAADDDDPPEPKPGRPGLEEAQRAAIIPGIPGQRWQAVKDSLELAGYRTAFHGIRAVPVYAPGSLVYAVRGGARLGLRYALWMDVTHLRVVISQSLARGDAGNGDVLRAHNDRERTKKGNRKLAAGTAATAALTSYVLAEGTPPAVQIGAAAAAFLTLVAFGKPDGSPFLPRAILPPNYQPPSFELIREALVAIIPAIKTHVAAKGDLDWVSDVHRDGDGWAVELDLPKGVTAELIIKKRKELSSALRRPLSAVWPEGVPGEHEGRLFIWIGRHDWAKKKLVPHPLLKAGTPDFFDLVPFGTMPRGNAITVPLFQTNWLFGGAMGSGKTSAIRTLLAAAALDTVVDLWTHEFSGKGDLEPYAQVSYRYVSGLDDEAIAYAAESVKMLKAELQRRQAIWKKIPREKRTEAHLTREIAMADKRLRPIVASFDECHNAFQHPTYGKQIQTDLEWVMRIGRAYGIVVILGTQRPGADSIPVIITAVTVARCCLKVSDHTTNDMILGSGSYNKGHDATVFRLPYTDAGCCWLKGVGDTIAPKIYYLNDPATLKIANRARALREKAGVLSGYALGEEEDQGERNLLGDVHAVFGPGERFLYWPTIAERLAEGYRGTYTGVTGDGVSADVRELADIDSDNGREPGGKVLTGLKRTTISLAVNGGPDDPDQEAGDDPPAPPRPEADTELLTAAAEMVIREQWASTSTLGRKLRLGHDRAGTLMDELAGHGVVGEPGDDPKVRAVLKTEDDLDAVLEAIRGADS
jgi:S-DNA-T family DNA segregation ATPase FtsK/SpoIIIE